LVRLAIETSTLVQSVALEVEGEVVESASMRQEAGHARDLADNVQRLLRHRGLAARDIDEVAVGAGPGSFTGLRIGLSLAKGIAFVTGAPIVSVPSFEAIAASLPAGATLAFASDARRGEVYGGLMSTGPQASVLLGISAWSPDAFAAALRQAGGADWSAGTGFDSYRAALADPACARQRLVRAWDTPTAERLLTLLGVRELPRTDASLVEPAYMRPHDGSGPREQPVVRPADVAQSSKPT
jgi:tRNA threonylcarbamoyladenosine biosynthesis protein TsaB